jgi:mRNA interferase RelE/StbE
MSYNLRFHELALKEWRKLDSTIREQFKKKLSERLENPRVPSAALTGMPDCYKIKLRQIGYRLIYRVEEDIIFVTVLSIGKREKLAVYKVAQKRLD